MLNKEQQKYLQNQLHDAVAALAKFRTTITKVI